MNYQHSIKTECENGHHGIIQANNFCAEDCTDRNYPAFAVLRRE